MPAKTSLRAEGFEAVYPRSDQLGWALAIMLLARWKATVRRLPGSVRYER